MTRWSSLSLLALATAVAGCGGSRSVPVQPTWADVAPVLRGECVGCHGWTASDRPSNAAGVRPENTGGSLRFDFYDWGPDVCGHAALAADPSVTLAGSPAIASQIAADVVPQNGAPWPAMPPQPSPSLSDWELEIISRWAAQPAKGPPPVGNHDPTIAVSQLPAQADTVLSFTAIIEDPDGDSVIGVIEVGDFAFLMNRSGSFAVRFDTSSWPPGPVRPTAVVCDGWTSPTYQIGPIEIGH